MVDLKEVREMKYDWIDEFLLEKKGFVRILRRSGIGSGT